MTPRPTRLHSTTDVIDPARARALQATLGQEPDIVAGQRLPGLFHHVYFWDPQPPDTLGPDGHPRPDSLIHGLDLPRRMWAAGRLVFHQPLIAGTPAERITAVEAVTRRDGRSGRLAFVRLRHDIRQRHRLALTEWQELVYREAAGGPAPVPPRAPEMAETAYGWQADSTMLFRYSALIFNGHRIHYDADYARNVEGYAGLVVHGPLLVQMLVLLAEAGAAPLNEITYRATAPLLVDEPARLCAQGAMLWVAGSDGRQCMIAQTR